MLKEIMIGSMCLSMASCATSFTGSPHVENGRSGCETKCRGQGMEIVGMVYMGEYSSACVCSVPGQKASRDHTLGTAGAVAGGVAGVEMQRQANQRNQQQYHGT